MSSSSAGYDRSAALGWSVPQSLADVWHWMGVVEEYPRDPSKVNLINNSYLNYLRFRKGESTVLGSARPTSTVSKQSKTDGQHKEVIIEDQKRQQRSPVSKQGSVVVVVGQSVSQISKRRKLN
jgi:hypothetical protein